MIDIQAVLTKLPTIYEEAITAWGEHAQLDMMIEECSELILAICHLNRGRKDSIEKVKEEAADVSIMLQQLKLIVGDWEDWEMKKLFRLAERIKAHREKTHE